MAATGFEPRTAAEEAAPLIVEWTTSEDGELVRTKAGMLLYLSIDDLRVLPSSTHGVSNYLIHCLLVALMHAGVAREDLTLEDRRNVWGAAREHLVAWQGVG